MTRSTPQKFLQIFALTSTYKIRLLIFDEYRENICPNHRIACPYMRTLCRPNGTQICKTVYLERHELPVKALRFQSHFRSTISALNPPCAATVSTPTVTGSRNRRGPHDPGLKNRTPLRR